MNNRGRTECLGEHLAETFGIPPKNTEIGNTMITSHGAITHVIHYIYEDDLETMEVIIVE